ncbi:hypothetical protein [Nocardioides sp. TF02-7]|uniref:hypothetical protein n=1 Tax=Nocardioides sp. TF02-7 TaxID=2917724 RepID=UPI001F054A01|nr:hypothetical protein [Nocardioides sp. TF02-7]UMG93512.1 hypothetical protein MF408_04675 [Nocardioides sp. TF02-7]
MDGAEPDQAAVRALVAGRGAQPVDRGQHLGHVGEELAPLAADPRPGAPPLEQGDAQLPLQLGDGLAECGLGEVELLAGPAEGAVLRHCGEVLELFDPHASSSRPPAGDPVVRPQWKEPPSRRSTTPGVG